MSQESSMTLRRDIIDHFLNTLSQKIKVDGVLLFGSYAYGKPDKHSDVDLIVISPNFKEREFWSRIGWMMQQRDDVSRQMAMDVIGYTPEEFVEADQYSSIMAKAKKDGVWLKKLSSIS